MYGRTGARLRKGGREEGKACMHGGKGASRMTYRLLVVGVAGGLEGLPCLGRLHELKVLEDEPGFLFGHGAEGKGGGTKGGREDEKKAMVSHPEVSRHG